MADENTRLVIFMSLVEFTPTLEISPSVNISFSLKVTEIADFQNSAAGIMEEIVKIVRFSVPIMVDIVPADSRGYDERVVLGCI